MLANLILALTMLVGGLSPLPTTPKSGEPTIERGPEGCSRCGSCVCRCRTK